MRFRNPTLLSLVLIITTGIIINTVSNVFGDGLFQENLPPATVGDRQASLFTQINPPVLTADSKEDKFFVLRLFDANNNQTIEHVSYFISVEKGGKLLMRDLFHSHQGLLKLKFNPSDSNVVVYGSIEPFLQGWVGETGDITVSGPVLLSGGLYHFGIEIFGIDNDRNIFTPENAPRFDAYLSVGDIFKQDIKNNNGKQNITIVSYYDQIQDFNFDNESETMSWSMPFDWNMSRIEEQKIFVHEEIKIPKSFSEFIGNGSSFNSVANGYPLTGRAIVLDPFTEENNLIIHYLLNKGDIINIGKLMNNGSLQKVNDTMHFSLSPKRGEIIKNTSTEIRTDLGAIAVSLNWDSLPIVEDKKVNLGIIFSDAISETEINGDVNYDLIIYDENRNEINRIMDRTAINGSDNLDLTFPSKGNYIIQITEKSIINNASKVPDESRKGIARGEVIVK